MVSAPPTRCSMGLPKQKNPPLRSGPSGCPGSRAPSAASRPGAQRGTPCQIGHMEYLELFDRSILENYWKYDIYIYIYIYIYVYVYIIYCMYIYIYDAYIYMHISVGFCLRFIVTKLFGESWHDDHIKSVDGPLRNPAPVDGQNPIIYL